MTKLKGILLTEGMHGMISQVEGLAKALDLEFIHEKIVLNNFWKKIPPSFTPVKKFVFKNNLDKDFDRKDFEQKNYNPAINKNKAEPSIAKNKKDNQYKGVKRQIKEEIEINENDESSLITIEEIQNNWKNFIDNLHIKKPSIASVLDNSIPVNFEKGRITIQITSTLEFHLNMIYKNSDLIKALLNDEFKIELDFDIEKTTEGSNDNQIQKTVDESKTQNDDQLRDKIVDLFDGEILT